jgi:hypothetical protein
VAARARAQGMGLRLCDRPGHPNDAKVSMRIRLAVTMISIAMLASPLAYGQVTAPSGKQSGPAVGSGDRGLIRSAPATVAPGGDALKNLAGGGYADPNYVSPGEKSKQSIRHRVIRTPRSRWASYRFTGYNSYKAFPCYCYCGY